MDSAGKWEQPHHFAGYGSNAVTGRDEKLNNFDPRSEPGRSLTSASRIAVVKYERMQHNDINHECIGLRNGCSDLSAVPWRSLLVRVL